MTAQTVKRILPAVAVLLLISFSSRGFADTPGSLTLVWDASTDPAVVGYRLYEGIASETYTNVLDVGSDLMVSVSGLVVGETYYFAVTAYDSSGFESPFSGEISYLVPSGAPPPNSPATLTISQNDLNQAVLSGLAPAGNQYDVYATLDLTTWLIIGKVTADANGYFQFTDLPSLALPWRFYQLRQRPAQPAVRPNILQSSN